MAASKEMNFIPRLNAEEGEEIEDEEDEEDLIDPATEIKVHKFAD